MKSSRDIGSAFSSTEGLPLRPLRAAFAFPFSERSPKGSLFRVPWSSLAWLRLLFLGLAFTCCCERRPLLQVDVRDLPTKGVGDLDC